MKDYNKEAEEKKETKPTKGSAKVSLFLCSDICVLIQDEADGLQKRAIDELKNGGASRDTTPGAVPAKNGGGGKKRKA